MTIIYIPKCLTHSFFSHTWHTAILNAFFSTFVFYVMIPDDPKLCFRGGEGVCDCVWLWSGARRKAKFLKRADRYTSTNVRCLFRAFFLVLLSCECAMSTRRKMLNYCCCGYFSTSKCLLVCSIFLQYREMKSSLQYLLPYVSIGSEETRSIPLKALEIRCSGGLSVKWTAVWRFSCGQYMLNKVIVYALDYSWTCKLYFCIELM